MRRAKRRCRASSAIARSSSAICLTTARELGAAALATGHYVASRRLAGGSRALVCAARCGPRPELFPVRAPRSEQLDFLRFPLGDMTKAADPRTGAAVRTVGRRQARQPGYLLRADRPLHRHHRAAEAECDASRATSSISTGMCSAATRASCISPSGSAAASASRPPRRSTSCGSMLRTRRVVVGPREALRMHRIALRDVNWIGDGALDALSATGSRCSSRCARRARRSRRGCARSMAATRSNWSTARRACRPDRPACFTMRRKGRRACSAADSSHERMAQRANEAADEQRAGTARRGRCADKRQGRAGSMGTISTAQGSPRPMARWAPVYDLVFGKVFDDGRQSHDRRSRQDRRTHARCRRRHRTVAVGLCTARRNYAASIFPSRCCARRRSACAR